MFGEYSQPAGLDPIVPPGFGTTGGIEMGAIYDTLMRFNSDTGKYEPRLAESLTNNADFTEWTFKIKPNVKFTDGTAYDAAAVVFGMNRHRSGTAGAPACETIWACPRNSQNTNSFMALVKNIEAVDNLTVKVTMSEPWNAFPWALASEAGMIPSPTALKKCDATKNPNTCDFNLKPVGAGPFMVDSFKPKDSINLVRNPNYWGGTVYLDGIKFVDLGDTGGLKTLDSLKTGTINAGFFSVPEAIAAMKAAKYDYHSWPTQAGRDLILNTGVSVTCAAGKPEPTCTGKPDGPTPTTPVDQRRSHPPGRRRRGRRSSRQRTGGLGHGASQQSAFAKRLPLVPERCRTESRPGGSQETRDRGESRRLGRQDSPHRGDQP